MKKDTFPKKCACCGSGEITEPHMICEICGWEEDSLQQRDPFYKGGANKFSLFEYEMIYLQKKIENPEYRWENQ